MTSSKTLIFPFHSSQVCLLMLLCYPPPPPHDHSQPDSLVVNIGDCLKEWSQGRLISTLHRVVSFPSTVETRYSIAFFASPSLTALMDWPHSAGLESDSAGGTTGGAEKKCLTYSGWRKQTVLKSMNLLKKKQHGYPTTSSSSTSSSTSRRVDQLCDKKEKIHENKVSVWSQSA